MAISTNAELVTAIGNWLDRTDLTDRIQEFIVLAEAMFSRSPDIDRTNPDAMPGIRCRAMMKRATSSVPTQYSDIPTDMLEPRNIQITASGTIKRLQYMTPEQLDYAFDSATTGTPTHYTIIGDEIQLAPIPNGTFTMEIAYYGRLSAIASTSTNWLLTNHPDIYLYGSLMQAEPYLANDARAITWARLYKTAAEALNRSEKNGQIAGPIVARSDISDLKYK